MSDDDKSSERAPSVAPVFAQKPKPGKKREAVVEIEPEPSRHEPPRSGRVRCKVEGANVVDSAGTTHPVGTCAEFSLVDVRSLPDFLIPLE